MDHLPRPYGKACTLPKIPYFCFEEYDRGDFLSYPERTGWTMDELLSFELWTELDDEDDEDDDEDEDEDGDEDKRTFEDVLDLLQTWLFFGSLHLIFQEHIKFEDFIMEDPDEGTCIHTKNLLKIAEEYEKSGYKGGKNPEKLQDILSCLATAYKVYNVAVLASTLDPYFLLSIGFLLDFLASYSRILYAGDDTLTQLDDDTKVLSFKTPLVPAEDETEGFANEDGEVPFLVSEMILAGWCPHLVNSLHEKTSNKTMYLASLLDPPDPTKNHTTCTRAKCLAYQMNKGTYVHKHVREGCTCEELTIDSDQLCRILQDGSFPVVKPMDPRRSSTSLELEAYSSNTEYVAISHVWSDGMGNPKRNAVAKCQMERIFNSIKELPGCTSQTPIWLDTLCCPVAPKDVKRLAIARMRDTYDLAASVLVLDKQLQGLPHSQLSPVEQVVRIWCSGWTGRLWTWQEGFLADRLYFQFNDGIFDVNTLQTHYLTGHRYDLYSTRDSAMLMTMIRGSLSKTPEKDPTRLRLDGVVDGLQGRSTSVPDDEGLCLGALMGCDVLKILDAKPLPLMCGFWQQCPVIPREILFWKGPRLSQPGFRWAPITLTNHGGRQLDPSPITASEKTGTVVPSGLLIRAPAILLGDVLDQPLCRDFYVVDHNGESIWRAKQDCDAEERPALEDKAERYIKVALLLHERVTERSRTAVTYGTLVYVYAEKDGMLFARRGGTVLVMLQKHPNRVMQGVGDLWKDLLKLEISSGEDVKYRGRNLVYHGEYKEIEGQDLPEQQQWVID
ncbi:hypothetical protein DBV05_g9258 [Lasiodiplodia theobromae]|uniref:Heterokaryon incompatibility domain-containing protein n=1 Tax=Lasiodiplodia theobromae TaxID=45133 RepID=A0A5N5D3G8_9PEZI|nr:hypothetical protein DBV05_g9258 [Lasiodiplodia theobromae]